jgi:hypothetical protein
MKFQDIGFLLILGLLLYFRNPKWFVIVGLLSLGIALPLFHFWVFFTAQRLVMYAAACFLVAALLHIFREDRR